VLEVPRVLILDSDSPERGLLAGRLKRGHEVAFADSIREAKRRTTLFSPDLILADVSICGTDGFQFCRWLKSAFRIPPSVILLSRGSDSKSDILGLDSGAQDLVARPFEFGELEARMRAALRTRAQMEALADDAATDPLTGLWNRRYIATRLTEFIVSAARTQRPLACVMLDLDGFKGINDQHGHHAGDAVLRETARRIRSVVRRSDVPFRFGGEEFLVLAPDTPAPSAMELGERIRRRLAREPIHLPSPARAGEHVFATTSVGVSVWSVGMEASDLLRRADQALYAAKRLGRNRVIADEPAAHALLTHPAASA
jgi:two-component system cell cycle response regulator